MARHLLALVLVSALAVGCGGEQSKTQGGQKTETQRAAPAPVITGAGKLVAIGGGRSLYVDCRGSGSPTAPAAGLRLARRRVRAVRWMRLEHPSPATPTD